MPPISKLKKTESRIRLSVYIETSSIKLKMSLCSRYVRLGFKYYIAKDSSRYSRYLKAGSLTRYDAHSPSAAN